MAEAARLAANSSGSHAAATPEARARKSRTRDRAHAISPPGFIRPACGRWCSRGALVARDHWPGATNRGSDPNRRPYRVSTGKPAVIPISHGHRKESKRSWSSVPSRPWAPAATTAGGLTGGIGQPAWPARRDRIPTPESASPGKAVRTPPEPARDCRTFCSTLMSLHLSRATIRWLLVPAQCHRKRPTSVWPPGRSRTSP
jgi:hypothetical protein